MSTWPVRISGVLETVVTTRGPNDRYNLAALGIFEPADEGHPRARTWGKTRTRRNFEDHGEGYVQFLTDPVVFVDAALDVRELDVPILEDAAAWVRVSAHREATGQEADTEWVDWRLQARESVVRERTVPAYSRGYGAVVEATVAVSRLGVSSYDSDRLSERIDYCESVVDRCGGAAEQMAFEHIRELMEDTE